MMDMLLPAMDTDISLPGHPMMDILLLVMDMDMLLKKTVITMFGSVSLIVVT